MFLLLHLLDYILKDISRDMAKYTTLWLYTGVAFYTFNRYIEDKEVENDEKYEGPPDQCASTKQDGFCDKYPKFCRDCEENKKYWYKVRKRKPPAREETKSNLVSCLFILEYIRDSIISLVS